ncbi:hypothetical protein QFZ41_000139 [Luteibacter sp. W1I16]|uniref:hypothetical protein n=1 Tax=Luteibacter sp. W1I16 TaxID=3373922 RepID=UPI003D1F5953
MIARLCLLAWLLATWAGAGAVAWLAIHRLTGGTWGAAIGPRLRRLRLLLPLAAIASIAMLMAAAHFFPWLHQPVETERRWYFGQVFLAWRTAACFAAWGVGAWATRRAPAATLILWLFACGVFANDWIVSLSPGWRSSAIGLVAALGQLVVAFTLVTLHAPAGDVATTRVSRDLGNLLIALCLGWAYLVGVDYLTAWMADLPYEAAWYLPRTRGAWASLAVAALLFHLFIPFAVLLTRSISTKALHAAAATALLGQACHLAWMVLP